MGTRHRQAVITKNGELKIQQYGQWDGYPSGQGVTILEYLRSGNLKKYQENLENIPQTTQKQLDAIDKECGEDWVKVYPYLSRDCGSRIHQMIEDGTVKFVNHIDEKEAKAWCEGFYTIDFKKGKFISEFGGIKKTYKLSDLPTDEEYLRAMGDTE